MTHPDVIRDQIRKLKYLKEEEKVLLDVLKKVEEQKNRLKVEELTLLKLYKDKDSIGKSKVPKGGRMRKLADAEENELFSNNYFAAATPSRPVSIPIVDLPVPEERFNGYQPNALAETIDLDVSKVLLKLARGGSKEEEEEEEEEEEDE